MIDMAQYESEFKEAQEIANEIAVKMSIARQGIDPELVSRQNFDRVMRLNMNILDVREKANSQINQINQDAAIEHNKLVVKIQEALARYLPKAQITPVPEVTPAEVPAEVQPEPMPKEKETVTSADVGKAEEVLGTS